MIPSVVCFYSFLFFSYFYFSVRQPSIEQGRSSPPPESRTVCPSWLRTPGQGASARSPRPWRRPWPLSGQSWASRWGDAELVWPEAEQEAALEKVTGQETEVGAVRAGAHTALEDGANFLLVTVWQKSIIEWLDLNCKKAQLRKTWNSEMWDGPLGGDLDICDKPSDGGKLWWQTRPQGRGRTRLQSCEMLNVDSQNSWSVKL